jgi:hypothetical protein
MLHLKNNDFPHDAKYVDEIHRYTNCHHYHVMECASISNIRKNILLTFLNSSMLNDEILHKVLNL